MTLGERIQELRKQKRLSQEKLAEHLNMSRQAIAKWEQDSCEPNIASLIAMSKLFEVNLDYLLTGETTEFGNNMQERNCEPIREHVKETIIIKEKENANAVGLQEILWLIMLVFSAAGFIALFAYALAHSVGYNGWSTSFIWWYIPFTSFHWGFPAMLFRLLVLITGFGTGYSIYRLVFKKKSEKKDKEDNGQ